MTERVHCLYRVSTTKQVDHGELDQTDIPVLRKACREFAKKMSWIIVGEERETGVQLCYSIGAADTSTPGTIRMDLLSIIKHQEVTLRRQG